MGRRQHVDGDETVSVSPDGVGLRPSLLLVTRNLPPITDADRVYCKRMAAGLMPCFFSMRNVLFRVVLVITVYIFVQISRRRWPYFIQSKWLAWWVDCFVRFSSSWPMASAIAMLN